MTCDVTGDDDTYWVFHAIPTRLLHLWSIRRSVERGKESVLFTRTNPTTHYDGTNRQRNACALYRRLLCCTCTFSNHQRRQSCPPHPKNYILQIGTASPSTSSYIVKIEQLLRQSGLSFTVNDSGTSISTILFVEQFPHDLR